MKELYLRGEDIRELETVSWLVSLDGAQTISLPRDGHPITKRRMDSCYAVQRESKMMAVVNSHAVTLRIAQTGMRFHERIVYRRRGRESREMS